MPNKIKLKPFLILSIGSILELYDFSLYALYVPIFTEIFFPSNDVLTSYLIVFCTFSLSHFVRPVGAIIFGYIADNEGRSISLSYSIILMSVFTLLIGILPTYSQIGIWACIILILCRIGQVLCVGGEYTNALVYAAENYSSNKFKAFSCALITASTMVGWFLGSLFSTIFITSSTDNYWRIPFIIGSIACIFGFYLRLGAKESTLVLNVLSAAKHKQKININIIKKNLASYIAGISIGIVVGIIVFSQFVFLNSFIPLITNISPSQTKLAVMLGTASYMLWLIIIGCFVDKIGQIIALKTSVILQLIFGISFFYALESTNPYMALLLGEFFSAFILALFVVPATYQLTQMFNIEVRASSVSLSYGIGVCFGGLSPSILMLLYKLYANIMILGCYLTLSAFFSYIAISIIIKSQNKRVVLQPLPITSGGDICENRI